MRTLSIQNGEVILTDGQNKTLVAILTTGAEAQAQAICDCWNSSHDLATKLASSESNLEYATRVNKILQGKLAAVQDALQG